MKTSITHFLKSKWRICIPILFLAAFGPSKGFAADCGVTIDDVTFTIDCEGALTIDIDGKDLTSWKFLADGSITTFSANPIIHATKIFDSEGDFTLEAFCADGVSQLEFKLPDLTGHPAGTYTFSAVGVISGPTNKPAGGSLSLSSTKENPTCASGNPNDMDGQIAITVNNAGVSAKCADNAIVSVAIGTTVIDVEIGKTATFTGLGAGSYTATATINDDGCPCAPNAVSDLGPIILTGPTSGTTSLACNAEINVSVSQSCEATIMVTDILRGVSDPCTMNSMISMIDSIRILSGGVTIGGSGGPGSLGVIIPDVKAVDVGGVTQNLIGQQLKVEVIDSESGNLCWGYVTLEDKSAPIVTCNDPALMEIVCLDYDNDVMRTIEGLVTDCSDFSITQIATSEINDCERLPAGLLRRVEVTYFAVDVHGNKSNTCTDTLDVLRFDTVPGNGLNVPGDILMPPQFVLDPKQTPIVNVDTSNNSITWPVDNLPLNCIQDYAKLDPSDPSNPAPAPISVAMGGTGTPYLFFTNENGDPDTSLLAALNYKNAPNSYKKIIDDNLANCNIATDFTDIIFDFGCKIKIQRFWTLREWSCPETQGGDGEQELALGMQEIIITDYIAPEFIEPVADMNFTVDADECSRFITIPRPGVADECDDIVDLEIAIYDMDGNLIGPNLNSTSFSFPTGMSFVVYTAFDDCGNQALDTAKVTVTDDTAPVVICKEFLVIGISGDGDVRLPVTSIDNGTYDQCDLQRVCVTRMDDLDLFNSLDSNNDGEVPFNVFNDALQARAAAGDGCYRDFSSSSYTRGSVAYLSTETLCSPFVDFCCADVGNQGDDGVMVEVRAFDGSGNTNRCMTFVQLQDKNPAVVTCLPNITVDCNFILPAYDATYDNIANDPLSEFFGSIVLAGNQKSFGVPDEFILSPDTRDYVDGTIFDNCNIPNISVRIFTNINSCGFGTITRDIFSDETGSAVRICRQIITIAGDAVLEVEKLFETVRDTTLIGCMTPDEIINESFGSPNINDVQVRCSQLGVSTENQLFLFNTQDQESDACFKVVRTFTVIDWCKSTEGNPYVVGTFRQIIKVNDPDGPTITCSDDLTGTNAVQITDCTEGQVMVMATGFDECTEGRDHTWTARVESDLDGDGIYESFNNDPVIISNETGDKTSKATHTANYQIGNHRITWFISDRCGNISQCTQNFTVVNVKKPTPFAIDITTVLMNSGPMVEVWAADLDNGKSVGPCGEALSMSMVRVSDVGTRTDGGFGIATSAITFGCADVGADGVPVNYFVYFDAGNGNLIYDYTTVNIKVQDNANVCNSVTSAFVTGNIHNDQKESIPNVSVELKGADGSALAIDAAMTNDRGDYAFPAMPQGGSYKIDPTSSDDYLNGVSTLDLVLIQRYILGMSELETPYRILAADINNDRRITAVDLVELRSVILGYKESFSNNESWRFIDENYKFLDPNFPLNDNLTEAYDISRLESDMSVNFIGLKVGDVNGSVDASSVIAGSRSRYNLVSRDVTFAKGEMIDMELSASELISSIGLQMALSFDANVMTFTGVNAGGIEIGSEHVGSIKAKNGLVSFSWSDYVAQAIQSGEEFFTIRFHAKKDGRLSDAVKIETGNYNSEIYNEDLEVSSLSLEFENKSNEGQFALQQNIPNPFAETTQISFYLPSASDATLTVSDMTGRIIKNFTGSFDKGNNYISISKDELAVSGVLYYTIDTDGFRDTKRMVVLK